MFSRGYLDRIIFKLLSSGPSSDFDPNGHRTPLQEIPLGCLRVCVGVRTGACGSVCGSKGEISDVRGAESKPSITGCVVVASNFFGCQAISNTSVHHQPFEGFFDGAMGG